MTLLSSLTTTFCDYYLEGFSTHQQIQQSDTRLVEWAESRWLVLSSLLFGLPALYGFQKGVIAHSVLLLATSGVSAGYWVCAKHSWRRNADLCLAKTSAVIFFVSGIYHIRTAYAVVFYTGAAGFMYAYSLSATHYRRNPVWVFYHFVFHMCIALETLLVINHVYY